MSIDVTTLTTRVIEHIEDDTGVLFSSEAINPSKSIFTDEDIIRAIQDGYDEIYSFILPRIKTIPLTLVAKQIYYDMQAAVPDFIGAIGIYDTAVNMWLSPTTTQLLDIQFGRKWELTPGRSHYFFQLDSIYLGLYPHKTSLLPGGESLDLYYWSKADTLGAASAIDITNRDEDILEHYCVADALEQLEEFPKAAEARNRYFESLEKLRTYYSNRKQLDNLPRLMEQLS